MEEQSDSCPSSQCTLGCPIQPASTRDGKTGGCGKVGMCWVDLYLAGDGRDSDPTQGGKDGFMPAWLKGRALVL